MLTYFVDLSKIIEYLKMPSKNNMLLYIYQNLVDIF